MTKSKIVLGLLLLAGVGAAHAQPVGPFVPEPGVREFTGQMIVRPHQAAELIRRGITGPRIRQFQQRAFAMIRPHLIREVPETGEFIVRVPRGMSEDSFHRQLIRSDRFEYAKPDWLVFPAQTPNDPRYGQQWHHPVIGSPVAWAFATGNDTIVAVVDTGVRLDHEDLRLVPGYNSVDRRAQVDGGLVADINGHGTHVAGCAAAVGNNGLGVSGVGWDLRVMPIRTSNAPHGGATTSDLQDGARWAASNGARVVSVSYAGIDFFGNATGEFVKSQNALLLHAAGNDDRELDGFFFPDVIVVGATDSRDRKADFSAYGRGTHVFAPGVDILSTTMDGSYDLGSGTSMAAPVANGAYALTWSVNPFLTPDEVQAIVAETCDTIGPRAIFSNGRINVGASVLAAVATLGQPGTLTGASTFIGSITGGVAADLNNAGDGTLNVASAASARFNQSAGVDVAIASPFPQAQVGALRVEAAIRSSDPRPSVILSLYNFRTGRYDFLDSGLLNSGTNREFSRRVLGDSILDYVDSSGNIRVGIRANHQFSRARRSAPPAFTMMVDMVRVVVIPRLVND